MENKNILKYVQKSTRRFIINKKFNKWSYIKIEKNIKNISKGFQKDSSRSIYVVTKW